MSSFAKPGGIFRKLKSSLKPDGRVAIIEYKRSGLFSFRRMFGHYVPKEIILEEMKKAGYRLKNDLDFFTRTILYNFFCAQAEISPVLKFVSSLAPGVGFESRRTWRYPPGKLPLFCLLVCIKGFVGS